MLDAQVLGYKLVLCTDVVVEGAIREWLEVRVRRRGGLPIAEKCYDYDVVFLEADCLVFTNQPLAIRNSWLSSAFEKRSKGHMITHCQNTKLGI